MITLTRLNDEKFILNVAHITMICANPDTIITLTNGEKIRAKETPDEIVQHTTSYMKNIGGVIHLSNIEPPNVGES